MSLRSVSSGVLRVRPVGNRTSFKGAHETDLALPPVDDAGGISAVVPGLTTPSGSHCTSVPPGVDHTLDHSGESPPTVEGDGMPTPGWLPLELAWSGDDDLARDGVHHSVSESDSEPS